MDNLPQRRALGAFIRARREAISPPPEGGRRRTPGLRREEAAARCRLSTTLYTWIEQGREISLSARSVAMLADGLHLTPAERAYLFELARHHDPAAPAPAPRPTPVPLSLLDCVQSIHTPAYLLDACFTARSWNSPAKILFRPWHDSGEANLLRFVFLVPAARRFIADWPASARRLAAEFRAETAHAPGHAGQSRLLDELRDKSIDFASFWQEQSVQTREGGLRAFNHPEQGRVVYTQLSFLAPGVERFRLMMLLPQPSQATSAETVISDSTVETRMARDVTSASRS